MPRGCFSRGMMLAVVVLAGPLAAAEPDREALIPLTPELRDRCLDVLRRGLDGLNGAPEEFWPAMHAAEALTLAGRGDEVVSRLRERLRMETDHQWRCGLAREIVRAGPREPLTVMFATLNDSKSNGRVHAAESLYKIAEIEGGSPLRAAFAQTENERLQLMAAAALGRAGNDAAIARLRASLNSSDVEMRKIGAWTLGLLGDASDIAPLKKTFAAETDELARAYFVNALACLNDPEARTTLGKNLSSSLAPVRTYSAEFAGYSRSVEFRPRLIEMLSDENVDVRVRSAQTLFAFSLPRSALELPLSVASEDVKVDVYPASEKFPRYSEGSIIALRSGSLLYATTEFAGGGADHSGATIVARTSTDGGRTWGPQRTIQENIGRQNVMSVTLRRLPGPDAPLGMFFLIKNSPTDLKVVLRTSRDEGQTFAEPIVVTPGPGYHVMNNDRVTVLSNPVSRTLPSVRDTFARDTIPRIICPVSWTADVQRGGHFDCVCFLSDDGGETWRASADRVDQPQRGAMEPEVVELADGRLMMIIRTQLGYIATAYSSDGGDHWSTPSKLSVVAPESPATIRRIPATGDLLLIWNNTYTAGVGHGGRRTPLTAAISRDAGQTWEHFRTLETNPQSAYAYTSVLFHKDRVLLSYYAQGDGGRISSRFRSLPVRWFYHE